MCVITHAFVILIGFFVSLEKGVARRKQSMRPMTIRKRWGSNNNNNNNNKMNVVVTLFYRLSLSLAVLLLAIAPQTCALSIQNGSNSGGNTNRNLSRRGALSTVFGTAIVGLTSSPWPSLAVEDDEGRLEVRRQVLLDAIESSKDEETIMAAIDKLVPLDPTRGRAATKDQDLDGEWKLLWSAKNTASPLLKLPYPFKPESYQYLGSAAASEVGPGRVAQGLTGGFLGQTQLWLSSGVIPSMDDPSVLIIQPPFRFEVGARYQQLSGGTTRTPKRTIVEAGSDAEFRQVNGRTKDAQRAPLNLYQQLYLEQQGKGSLRISKIIEGDPVIVGDILVHRKL